MKKIALTRGKFTLVDDSDYKELSRWKWNAHRSECGLWTAQRRNSEDKIVYMHRQILGLVPGDGKEGDHKNHNSLDNRRSNIRICTRSQNAQNTRKIKRETSSQFKGVCWNKQRSKWRARINVCGKDIHLGLHKDEIRAAEAYDEAAKQYFGDFACGNFL